MGDTAKEFLALVFIRASPMDWFEPYDRVRCARVVITLNLTGNRKQI